jgi:hypothetical protein
MRRTSKPRVGEKRVRVASQDLEQFLRKVYRFCKKTFMSVSELDLDTEPAESFT